MNLVIVKGNLTKTPELQTVNSNGKDVSLVKFTVATSRYFKKADGSKGQETNFIPCEAWDSAATFICNYLKKGDPILLNGELKTDHWETPEGVKRTALKVRLNSFEQLYRAPKREPDNNDNNQPTESTSAEPTETQTTQDDNPF